MKPLLLALPFALISATAAAKTQAPTVAVMYFDYEGEDKKMGMLRKGLSQMIISDLAGHDTFEVVERTRLQEILEELKLNTSTKVDKKTANKIGKLLGAKYMVLGGYFDLMGTLRVDARVVEVETGKILRSVGAGGAPGEFLELEQKIVGDLKSVLTTQLKGFKPTKRRAGRRKRAKPPKKLKVATAVKYSEALDAMDRKDKKAAKKAMKEVLKEQPDFALAQLDLESIVQ